MRTQIGRHHDHGVAKVHRAPVPVGETSVIQHLQQHVEHIRMRLFDFVEQDDAVGTATDGLG